MGAFEHTLADHILAELTACGYLVLSGLIAVQWLGATLPALAQARLDRRCREFTAGGIRGEKRRFRPLLILAALTLVCFCGASSGAAQLISSPDPVPAKISGTVLDTNGGVIPGAKVTLDGATPDDHLETVAGDNGFFQFADVHPGVNYHVTVTAQDFADWTSTPIVLTPGQYFLLPSIQLRLATVQISVVAVTPEQAATEQVKEEEKQRILGVIPNFYVVYNRQPAPLSAKLKFHLAMKALNDPVTIAGFLVDAGIYQAADYPSYRGGMAGYGQRLGATFAGGYTHILVGDALLPVLFHQDPRYFYQSTGTTRSRAMHALSNAIFTTGDNGRRQINYSNLTGDLISGAVANAYYPDKDRGAGLVIRGSLIGTGGRIIYALAEQFVLNRPAFRGDK